MNLLIWFPKSLILATLFTIGSLVLEKHKNGYVLREGFSEASTVTAAGSMGIYQDGTEIGIGPFKKVDLGPNIDMALAEQGKVLYEGRCTACHKFEERFVGPPLGGITERRNPVWVMNMIINPAEMVEKDPLAKDLLAEYQVPMMNMGVNEEDTRAILEYLRAHDQGKIK